MFPGISLGVGSGGGELRLPVSQATDEAGLFVVDTGDGEATRGVNLGSVLDSYTDVLGGAINADVGEYV